MTNWKPWLLPACCWILLGSGFVRDSEAGSGTVCILPQANVKATSGLRLEVDTRWIDGNGYRPVRIRVSPLRGGAAAADRRIQVRLTPHGWPTSRAQAAVTAIVDLTQGSPWGEIIIPVPCSEIWGSMDLQTREGGKLLADLTEKRLHLSPRSYYEWNEASPAVLVVDRDVLPPAIGAARATRDSSLQLLPDFRVLAGLMPVNYWNGTVAANLLNAEQPASDTQLLQLLLDVPRFDVLPPAALPTDWIALTSIDVMFVSLDDLRAWSKEYPLQLAAVRSWLATGPALCVYGVGDEYQQLSELEELVGAPPLEGNLLRGWSAPDVEQFGESAIESRMYINRGVAIPQTALPKTQKPLVNKIPFVIREVEQGRLVAFAAETAFPGDINTWNWMLKSVDHRHWMWFQRHGLSLQTENNEYWNLLIPGVGEAPVNSFIVLITLFVIVIGPVNYYWLQRHKRLYLLLITVPAGALTITAGLLCYALITDGIGVRSRIRSIATIDQRTERVVSWSRQSYYAGLAPSGGLLFPRDAAVIPVDFRPRELSSTSRGRRLRLSESQTLSAGYFPPRTTTQFSVLESRRTDLKISVGEVEGDVLPIRNQLGVRLRRLVVRGPGGEYYGAESIGDGESRRLPIVDLKTESAFWNSFVSKNRPQYPTGFKPNQIEDATRFFGANFSYNNQTISKPAFGTSIYESILRTTVNQKFAGLRNRSYITIVENGPELSVGTSAESQANFHVVLGRW